VRARLRLRATRAWGMRGQVGSRLQGSGDLPGSRHRRTAGDGARGSGGGAVHPERGREGRVRPLSARWRRRRARRAAFVDQVSERDTNPLLLLFQPPIMMPMVSLSLTFPHMRLSSAVRLQHERNRELPFIVGRKGVPDCVLEVPMDLGGDQDAPLERH
jgi:hypothetical protein